LGIGPAEFAGFPGERIEEGDGHEKERGKRLAEILRERNVVFGFALQ
jgi:hypothetical protein